MLGVNLSIENCHFTNLYSKSGNFINADGLANIILKNITIENAYTKEKGLFSFTGSSSSMILINAFLKNITSLKDGGIFYF